MKCPDSPTELLLPIAVLSRLQSREGAESIAIRGAPAPAPRCYAEAPEPRRTHPRQHKGPLCPPIPRTRAHIRPSRPTMETRGRGSAGGGRRGGRGPKPGIPSPEPRARNPTVPVARKAEKNFFFIFIRSFYSLDPYNLLETAILTYFHLLCKVCFLVGLFLSPNKLPQV